MIQWGPMSSDKIKLEDVFSETRKKITEDESERQLIFQIRGTLCGKKGLLTHKLLIFTTALNIWKSLTFVNDHAVLKYKIFN